MAFNFPIPIQLLQELIFQRSHHNFANYRHFEEQKNISSPSLALFSSLCVFQSSAVLTLLPLPWPLCVPIHHRKHILEQGVTFNGQNQWREGNRSINFKRDGHHCGPVHFLSTVQSIDIIGQWSINRGDPKDLTRYSQLYDRFRDYSFDWTVNPWLFKDLLLEILSWLDIILGITYSSLMKSLEWFDKIYNPVTPGYALFNSSFKLALPINR